ncbi:MAG TPA: pyruvate ferredoxin oxidoreductase [bacterium]|nr:pyruvate ferredoxin oxidoreductase [bacterium]
MRKVRMAFTGNEAVAYAMKQINPDVVAVYPITPQTEIMHSFSKYVADGEVDTNLVTVESEHSAMSACVGASAAGARVMTATASQGLALMHEILYIASALRLPIVMPVVNRALSAPINIHCDHSDMMGSRDSGWIQIFTENANEAYHSVILGVKLAEKVNLPVMIGLDGFIISHGMEVVETLPTEEIRNFLGERKPVYSLLDVDNPITVGPLDLQDYFFEHKRAQIEAMEEAREVIPKVHEEYNKKFETNLPDFVEPYKIEDAELGVIAMGSAAGTMKEVVDKLREKGKRVGLLRIRIFRPFPSGEILKYTKHLCALGIMDRAHSLSGLGGPLWTEVRSVFYGESCVPPDMNFIYGLGGRDFFMEDGEKIFDYLEKLVEGKEQSGSVKYIGLRE